MTSTAAGAKPLLLAFSGGLDTSFCVPWLAETYDRPVVTLTVDTGGIDPGAAQLLAQRSAALGAVAHHLVDARAAYFDQVLDEREREPKDDLLSEFLVTEIDGVRLTRHEILDICFLFLIAGLDTVTATLDCMFAFLAEHPDHRRQIVEDPELIPSAVEEMLRWETPVMGIVRAAVADAEIAGCPVK